MKINESIKYLKSIYVVGYTKQPSITNSIVSFPENFNLHSRYIKKNVSIINTLLDTYLKTINKKQPIYYNEDDDNDMLPSQKNNFVRTANNQDQTDSINGYGLTNKCTNMVIKILNKN